MKKYKSLIILILICVFQLSVPLFIISAREIAENAGLEGKIAIEDAWYDEKDGVLEFDINFEFDREIHHNAYISVHLNEEGYLESGGYSVIKPSGPYIDPEKFTFGYHEYEDFRMEFLLSKKEVHDIIFKLVCDKPYGTMKAYITVSVFNGEVIFKDLWVDDTKLLNFR